jgi:hypothetical protein
VALVEREGPLTYAEAKRLGLGMTLLISEAKEEYIQKLRNGSYNLYSPHIQATNQDYHSACGEGLGYQIVMMSRLSIRRVVLAWFYQIQSHSIPDPISVLVLAVAGGYLNRLGLES